jgi:site-specific DNA-methyltransferase (adenine-specific)
MRKVDGTEHHPCPKPLPVMTWAIERTTPQGADIFDPFAGSGTTLVAAKRMGRRAIGVELSEAYCEIAANRLAQGVLDFGAVS